MKTLRERQKEKESEDSKYERLMSNLRVFPNHRCTTTVKIARRVLLNDFIIAQGTSYTPKAKSRGCGVYEVWLEEKL